MLEVRFTIVIRPDTDDPDEAREEAEDFLVSCRDWPSSVRRVSEMEITEMPEDDDE